MLGQHFGKPLRVVRQSLPLVPDDGRRDPQRLAAMRDAQRAQAVAALARDAGYEATVGDRFRTADVVWLDIDRRSNAGLPALEGLQASAGAPARLELRPCPGETAVAAARRRRAGDAATAEQ